MSKVNKLQQEGFVKFDISDEIKVSNDDLKSLQAEFNNLPEDSYAPGLNRFRRYSRAVIIPGKNRIEWVEDMEGENGEEVSEYFQGTFNPEFTDEYRCFPSLTKEAKENELLNKIIQIDFNKTYWGTRDALLPVHVGVHFVKLKVEEDGQEAVSSPNHLHQDGEPFTFAHLISAVNLNGGSNAIATPKHAGLLPEDVPSEDLLAEFKLENPLESYGVSDKKVSHYVSSIKKDKPGIVAERAVILIDFMPTVVAQIDTSDVKEKDLVTV
ncbi:2OG-Fe dioxygenase family protein [Priestia megaterium]|uniref:2OG-Fe dioxygenase family protein n=1 Tax=Priestia megaterium TaxID=1404 RepID=UPI002E20259A|nr:2OG-Fe dioxygenase family protein [Priestia megaterium]MED4217841.1 2OG-Fe dioxygenase family protein [Priestia megaterium]